MNKRTDTSLMDMSDPVGTDEFLDDLQTVRSHQVDKALYVLAILGLPALIATIFRVVDIGWHPVEYFYIAIYLVNLGTILFIKIKRLSFPVRTSVLIGILVLLGISALVSFGLAANGILILATFSILTSVLFGTKKGIIATGISLCMIGTIGVGVVTGIITFAFDINHFVTSMTSWITAFLCFSFLIGLAVISSGAIQQYLANTFRELSKHRKHLEELVKVRTTELSKSNEKLKQEVGERKKTEETLRESEEKYRQLFTTVSDAIMVFDAETSGVLDVNEAALKMYGYSKEEFLSLKHTDITSEEEESDKFIKQVLSGELTRIPLRYHKRKDGTVFPIEISSGKMKLRDKDVLCGIIRDITERKQAEKVLSKEKDFIESLIDTAQVVILLLDTEGRIVRFNRYMEDLSGYKLEEVQGKDWFSTFLPEQDYDRIRELFRTAVSDIQTWGNINPIVAKDGREIIVEWYDKTLKDAAGNTVGLLAIGQDITGRKQVEDALRESKVDLDKAQKLAHIGNWSRDLNLNRAQWSDEMYRILGLTPGDPAEPSFEFILSRMHPAKSHFI